MEISSLCMVFAATLSIQLDKSQFFQYDSISLICAAPANHSGWTLRKINSSKTPDPCPAGSCTIYDVMQSDTGVYMCQSDQGGCSNTVNITVPAGSVILEMSSLPVTTGDTVTLRCVYMENHSATPSSAFEAMFYKDDVFIGTEPTGERILRSVSNLDAGFYGCEHPKEGKSLVSWLTVRDGPVSTSRPPVVIMSLPRLVCTVLLVALFSTTSILCVYVHCKWTKAQQKARSGTI